MSNGLKNFLNNEYDVSPIPNIKSPNLMGSPTFSSSDTLALGPLIAAAIAGSGAGIANYMGRDVRQTGDGTVIAPNAEDIERARAERDAELRGRLKQPPPKVDEGIILKGPDPADLEGLTGFPPVDPIPPQEKPEPVGKGFGADLPPKTLDDYILTMAKKDKTETDVLDDIKQGVGEFQDTYKEPLSKSSQAAGREERVGVKSFVDLVPDGEAKMGTLKDNFRNEYNKIANLPDKKTQIESLNKLQESSGFMYDYLIKNTDGLKQNYNNLSATKALDTRLADPNSPESIRATKQDLITDYWINKTAEYAAGENVPMITDADGKLLPALNQDTFFDANKAVAELREMHKNHPNKKVAEWFASLPDGALGARRIRAMFGKQVGAGRQLTYTEDIRNAVQENVGYINDSLIPEVSFRSRIMKMPKVQAALSIASRRLDYDESFVRKQMENFLAEYFRSRDAGARSGVSGVMDAETVIKLVNDSGLFNPLSENFISNNKDFKDYLDIRAKQLPGQDLSHKSTTQNPDEAGIAPYSGVEADTYKLLPEKTNREIQRQIEADAKIALGDKDYKTLERLDREADKYGIETKVTVGGETYSLGMGDNYEFIRDEFVEKYGEDLDKFSNGGPVDIFSGTGRTFAPDSRLSNFDQGSFDMESFKQFQLPSYEDLYGSDGKFPINEATVDRLRQEALEAGKIYYGDATGYEHFKNTLFNLPDAAYQYAARSGEGLAELVAGTTSWMIKNNKIAMSTDPDEIAKLLEEPSFTKYMGAFRGKLGDLDLYESEIYKGDEAEKAIGTLGYYTGPPTAALAAGFSAPAKFYKSLTNTPDLSSVSKISEAAADSSKLVDAAVAPARTDAVSEVDVVVPLPATKTKTDMAPAGSQIDPIKIDEKTIKQADSNPNYIAPRHSEITDYVKVKYADQPNTKKKLSAWKFEMENSKGANMKTQMIDSGYSSGLNAQILATNDATIDAVDFLNMLNKLPNQLSSKYSSKFNRANSAEIKKGGSYKSGRDMSQQELSERVERGRQNLAKVEVNAPGETGKIINDYKVALSNMLDELQDQAMLGNAQRKRLTTNGDIETPGQIIDKYTKKILPNIIKKFKNKDNAMLFTEMQELKMISDRLARANINPRYDARYIGQGLPGITVEDYTILEHAFAPTKKQSSRHSAHSNTHPDGPYTISFSRSADLQSTDGRLTEHIMETQSDVHRGTPFYKTEEAAVNIKQLETSKKSMEKTANSSLNSAWADFSPKFKDLAPTQFEEAADNLAFKSERFKYASRYEVETLPNSFKIRDVETGKLLRGKEFGTIEDANDFISAKNKLDAAKKAKDVEKTELDEYMDLTSEYLFQKPYKSLSKSDQRHVKAQILEIHGKATPEAIAAAKEYMRSLTPNSMQTLAKSKNPEFMINRSLASAKEGDSMYPQFDKYWNNSLTMGDEGETLLLERLLNDDLPRTTADQVTLSNGVIIEPDRIKRLVRDAYEGFEASAGVGTPLSIIRNTIVKETRSSVPEVLRAIFPDEAKAKGDFLRLSEDLNMQKYRYARGGEDYPLKKQKDWVKNSLKAHIEKAIEEGKSMVSWNPGEIVGVYESADKADIAGFKTIYSKLLFEAAEDINKALAKRAKMLGIDPEKVKIKISKTGEDSTFTIITPQDSNLSGYVQANPDIVKVNNRNNTMELTGLPYIDFSEAKDIIRKIGLPQHADGGRVGSKLPSVEDILGRI